MYTPKGELNDQLLALMQEEENVKAFEGCKSPEEGYEVVKRFIPGISMEEFQESMQIMAAYLEENADGLLNDEDLDAVAGGKSTAGKVAAGLGGASTAIGIVGTVISSLAFTA